MTKKIPLLRICASCEWIFLWKSDAEEDQVACPRCQWPSYGARWAIGSKCYKFKFTQEPWMDRQIMARQSTLLNVVKEYNNANYPGWDDPPY